MPPRLPPAPRKHWPCSAPGWAIWPPLTRAAACDATITPIVTGNVDLGVLDDLVRLCLQLAGPSLPLDIGYSTTIPPGIRNAVILTAWNPDRTKVLHSHSPPARAG